jgi:PKHD-type hydroxylase
MLLHVRDVLTPAELAQVHAILADAPWADGRATAGVQSAQAKHNEQLPQEAAETGALQQIVMAALNRHALFFSAALPKRLFPPLFNRYAGTANAFGNHVDNAVRFVPGGRGERVRTDISCTLFLVEPGAYDGGELVVEDTYGIHSVKLPAGHMVLYPSSSLHHVRPVTRGARIASFFWIQSMVRDDGERTLLFDLDTAIQRVNVDVPDHPSTVQLTAVYHNLLRRWADL